MNLGTIMYDDIFLNVLLFFNIVAMYVYMDKEGPIKLSTAIVATCTIRATCSYVTKNPLYLFHIIVLIFTIITIIFRGLLLTAYLIKRLQYATRHYRPHISVLVSILLLFILLEMLKHSKLCLMIYKGG